MGELLQNPAAIVKDILRHEVQGDTADKIAWDSTSYNENADAGGINYDIDLAFTVHDKQINSKKLIEGIASNTRLIPYIKNNTLYFQGINPSPSPELTTDTPPGDVDMYIESSDIISYTNKRTSPEQVYSEVIVKYNMNYLTKEFSDSTKFNDNTDTASEFFDKYDIVNLGLKLEQELTFEAHYIRSDNSAQALQEFLLLWHCNQHNVLKLKVPLKYIQLKIGDYVGFDKLINGVKLFGEDYSIEHFLANNVFRNGQQILPVWMITSTNKTLTHIDIEMIQMHNCSDTVIDSVNVPPVIDSFNLELIHPDESLQGSHVIGNNIVLTDTTDYKWFEIKFTFEAHDPNNDDVSQVGSSWVKIDHYPLHFYGGSDNFDVWGGVTIPSFGNDHAIDNDNWTGHTNSLFFISIKTLFSNGESTVYLGDDPYFTGTDSGTWLTDFLEDTNVLSGSYKEIPAGTYVSEVSDGEHYAIKPFSHPIRIYKDEFPTNAPGIVTIPYNAGWNLVSLPMEVEDVYYHSVFPDAIEGSLYGFDGTYGQLEMMQPGKGYWLNFEESGSVTIDGIYQVQYEIELISDWNLIGGIGINDINFWNIVIDSGGILIDNSLFGFDLTYLPTDDLVPGKAYWIRTSAAGTITINAGF